MRVTTVEEISRFVLTRLQKHFANDRHVLLPSGKLQKYYWRGFYTVLRIVDARSYARKTTTNYIRAVYTPLDVNHASDIIAKQSSFAYNALGVVRVT